MKKITYLLAALLITSSSLFAQKLENSTLWKITGNDLEEASYLFGTIHVTCDATLSDQVKNALSKTSQLVLEIDMDDPEMQSKMMSKIFMKEGKTLKDFVNDQEYVMIDSLLIKNVGMSVKMMERMKPFFIGASFLGKLIDCPMQSFELELMKIAKSQNEEIKGLETIEDQLEVFDNIPYEDQIKDLLESAKDNLASDKEKIKSLTEVYNSQDISRLFQIMTQDDGATSKYMDILLDNRNKKWISNIEDFVKNQPTFFGVGAGHLPGENGVIKLLRKAGFTVTAVKQ
tara:strand:- start:130 stop:990 length:861 start_codon:yes stop_codon:yes gene_type:complete